jgi:hypothetical protein
MAGATSYRPRSATELVDGAIQLYRTNFAIFLMLGAVLSVPTLIVQWTVLGAANPSAPAVLFALAFFLIWWTVGYSLIVTVASDLYTTGTADVSSAIPRTVARLGPAIGATTLGIVGVCIGLVLLVIPGIYLTLSWFAIPAVAVLEPLGPTTALARSTALSRDIRGHIGVCLTIMGLLTGAIKLLAWFVGTLLAALVHQSSPTEALLVGQFGAEIGNIFLGALAPIMATLLYYDTRIRKEGYDIELMARSVGGTAAPATAY